MIVFTVENSIYFLKDEFLFWAKIWSETDQSETSIMKLAYAKNNSITDKKRNFFLRIVK